MKPKTVRFRYPLDYGCGKVNDTYPIIRIESGKTEACKYVYFKVGKTIYVGLAEKIFPVGWKIVVAKISEREKVSHWEKNITRIKPRDNNLVNPRIGRKKIRLKQTSLDRLPIPESFEGEQTLEELGMSLGQIDSALENNEGNIRLFDEQTGKWLDYVINPEVPSGKLGTATDYRKP